LNCHSSGDGIDFFGTGQPSVQGEAQRLQHPCIGDGLLEVVGTRGVADLVAIRLQLQHSRRLGQGSTVVITFDGDGSNNSNNGIGQ